ncbi:hypothetical protein Taro_047187 [Colocasia esculenta]|uniref:Diphosphomevalonate decarboxylase n=1 Tax=Colocasia esculenta TaxID=4460 RepID=A0A843X0C2_COLES|nr:hypothetical protein [Colocasia esculenta]
MAAAAAECGEESWVLTATARSPTNIAVIKYWGKRDEALVLPINDSISVTLDPDHLSATTTAAVSPAFDRDRIWLNGKEISLSGGRYQNCLRELRRRARDVELKEKGIRIRGEDWEKLHIHIASYNNFPTAAGLASSAAGFACLVFALAKLMNLNEDDGDLSSLARFDPTIFFCPCCKGQEVHVAACMVDLSSGKWEMQDVKGNDSIAVQLANESHWNDLVILIAVVSSRQKETSSTAGMRDSVETSSLLHHRAKTIVPERILQMEEAIRSRDFTSFAQLTCADSNQFHAVCLDTSPPIFYMNDTSHRQGLLQTIINSVERWNQVEGKPQVAYTFDAGPNSVLIAPNRKVACLLLQRLLFYFPPHQDNDLTSYVIGDTSILQEAGLHSNEDVGALQPPPEIKDKAPHQRYPGDISYFICTRPGRGPMLLPEDQALINPVTGLPK